ncbi:hypothetical protein [Pseudomonas sp. 1121_17]|uniref:hypothetical protein n=1 Tax=Pseudomonas sp. 1121_17 TaxID=2604458 RepID=UPI0040631293
MDQVEIKRRESSIVVIGTFDPREMAPHWFVKHGLIPQEDYTDALEVDVVYSEMTKFTLGNIIIEILPTKIILRSGIETLDYRIHDLALGILTVIKGAGVSAIGFNVFNDWYFEDVSLWHKVGDLLAPKQPWLDAIADSPKAGLMKMQMQVTKPEGVPGVYNVGVSWLEEKQWIRFSLNDHYDESGVSAKLKNPYLKKSKGFDAVSVLTAFWQHTLDFQKHIVNGFIEQARSV